MGQALSSREKWRDLEFNEVVKQKIRVYQENRRRLQAIMEELLIEDACLEVKLRECFEEFR